MFDHDINFDISNEVQKIHIPMQNTSIAEINQYKDDPNFQQQYQNKPLN